MVAQLAKSSLCKHEDLCLVPSIYVKTLGLVTYHYSPTVEEADPGGLLGLAGHPGQPNQRLLGSVTDCLKTEGEE